MPHRYQACCEFGCFKSGGPKCATLKHRKIRDALRPGSLKHRKIRDALRPWSLKHRKIRDALRPGSLKHRKIRDALRPGPLKHRKIRDALRPGPLNHRYQACCEFGCFKSGGPKCPTDTRRVASLGALNLVAQSAPR